MPKDRLDLTAESVPTVITPMIGRGSAARRSSAARVGPPDAIGGYPVICSLGVGGMAQVYLCHSKGIGGFQKLLVVKAPRADVLGDADTIEMFLNEARIAGRLNHPNVVQTNEVGLHDGVPFMAMEFLEGQSLSAIQRKISHEKLSTDFQLRVISNALAGLHYAHELEDYHGAKLGIVHRDISPQNIFVTYDGLTKLLDFGIAKASGSAGLTREGVIKGKISYIAPEQGALEPVDRRADIFSVGIMIWEAATHRRLVPMGSDELAVLRRRVAGEDPKAHEVAHDVPPELSEICSRAMALRPEDRYQTARELKDAVESYLMTSSRPTESDVGRFMCEAFAEERVQVHAQIDEQLRLRVKPSDTFHSTPPHASEASTSATVMDAESAQLRVSAVPPPARTKATMALSALLALVTAGLGASLLLGRHGAARGDGAAHASSTAGEPPLHAAPPDASPSASASAAAPARIRVVIRAIPPRSELVVDGTKVDGGTFEASLAPSKEPHRVQASAPGFSPSEQLVVFDRDVRLDVTLVELSPRVGTPPRVAPSRPQVPAPRSSPVTPSARPIDEKDPYQ